MGGNIVEIRDLYKRFPKRENRNGPPFWSKLILGHRRPKEWTVAVDGISLGIQE